MKMVNILFAIAILISCSSKDENRIHIKSEFRGTVDSLNYDANLKRITSIQNVNYGFDTVIYYSPEPSGHNVMFTLLLYMGGKSVNTLSQFSDLGYFPTYIDVVITDSLKLKIKKIE